MITLATGFYTMPSLLRFSSDIVASEIRIVGGVDVDVAVRTSPHLLDNELFSINDGSPHVHFSQLRFHSPVSVSGSKVTFDQCAFASDASLIVRGGSTEVTESSFEDINGVHAAAALGGELILRRSAFRRCWVKRGELLRSSDSDTYDATQIGAALLIDRGEVLIEDCDFMQNNATVGGAIAALSGTLVARRTHFMNNSAQEGGALCVVAANVRLTSCTFERNLAVSAGAVLVNCQTLPATSCGVVLFSDCLLEANEAAHFGGAMQVLERPDRLTMTAVRSSSALRSLTRVVLTCSHPYCCIQSHNGKVRGGVTILSNNTLFISNLAGFGGASLDVYTSTVTYVLPAPAGRWIASAFHCKYYPLLQQQPCSYERAELQNRTLRTAPIPGHRSDERN